MDINVDAIIASTTFLGSLFQLSNVLIREFEAIKECNLSLKMFPIF